MTNVQKTCLRNWHAESIVLHHNQLSVFVQETRNHMTLSTHADWTPGLLYVVLLDGTALCSRIFIFVTHVRHLHQQEAHLVLTKYPTLVHDVMSRADLWWMTVITEFLHFCLHLSPLMPSTKGIPQATGFIFGTEKLEWLGYNLVKVAWWSTQSFGHNTSTWHTDSHVAIANSMPMHYAGSQKIWH